MMSKESISGASLEKTITSDDLLGKEVIDSEGKTIGITEKVLFDPRKLEFVGVEIDKGFLKKGISIGKNYLERITPEAIFLKIKVLFEVRGLKVFDNQGEELGVVTKVELTGEKNVMKQIFVKKLFRQELAIPKEYIEVIGHNIILNQEKIKILEHNKILKGGKNNSDGINHISS